MNRPRNVAFFATLGHKSYVEKHMAHMIENISWAMIIRYNRFQLM